MTSLSSPHEIVKYGNRKLYLSYPNCKIHDGEICTVECQNCNVEVCIKCLSREHNGHRIIEIHNVVEEKKRTVDKDTVYLTETIIPKFEKADSEIVSKLAALNARCDELEKSVKEHGKDWHRLIEDMVEKNNRDISEMRESGIRTIKEYQKYIKKVLKSLHEITLQNKKISQSFNVSDITKYECDIQKYLKIPLKIELELPTFVFKDIDKDKLDQIFGELRKAKIQTELIHRPDSDKLLDKAYETGTFPIGIIPLHKLACLSAEEVWITGQNKTITRFNKHGFATAMVTSTCSDYPSDISVSKDGHLLYIDAGNHVVNDLHQTTARITAPQGWSPSGLFSTKSGDLLVSMCTFDEERYKIVRYEGKIITQEIEKDEQGSPLFKGGHKMLFVTENINGDICASDCNANLVTVVNKKGTLRYWYKGQESMKDKFRPANIVTDSAGRVLVKDTGNKCLHVLDQECRFLRNLDFYGALSVDTLGQLWVGEFKTGIVKIIRYAEKL
ncbi:uncharacterized protein LOC134277845 [Saccostrea cucullata]|uniref:uncharacterized protein LOC134277845 n=1 Tax=Saccostrea cuccullata TaxID=36930 RepID=UPI002ED4BB0B